VHSARPKGEKCEQETVSDILHLQNVISTHSNHQQ